MKPIRLWVYKMLTSWIPESRGFEIKCALLRWAGAEIGRNVRIYSSAHFVGTGSLKIENDVHIGSGVFVSSVSPYGVTIGSHVDVGPQVMILTGTHAVNPSDDPKDSSDYLCTHMGGEGTGGVVVMEDGCWIGARSVLLPGVKLPRKTLVAAGSTVTKAITNKPKCLMAGAPAIVKKEYGV